MTEEAATVGTSDSPLLSVIVPAHNEAGRLDQSLPALLGLANDSTEVVFVDDGSSDATGSILADAARSCEAVKLVRLPANLGKGGAVRAGVAVARGGRIAFMDADLSTDLRSLPPLLGALDRSDVAIGSRAIPGAVIEASSQRRSFMGDVFNRLVRASTGVPFRDTQCGFKAFRAAPAKILFQLIDVRGFAFDVQLILLALAMNLRVEEVPVRWRETEGSHVRPLRDPLRMAYDVVSRRRRAMGSVVCLSVPVADRWRVEQQLEALGVRDRMVVAGASGAAVLLPFTTPAEVASLRAEIAAGLGVGEQTCELRQADAATVVELVQQHSPGDRSLTASLTVS